MGQVESRRVVAGGAEHRPVGHQVGLVGGVVENQDVLLGLVADIGVGAPGLVMPYFVAVAWLAATPPVTWQLEQFISLEAGTTVST